MRTAGILATALLIVPGVASSQAQTTAFVNVSVLPMDRERILEDHTVLIQDGLIVEVAPSHRVSPPQGATVIDGQGLFLMPGLADMHVTLPSARATEDEVKDFLFLLLANNVLTARGLDGTSNHLAMKREIEAGGLLGPTLWVGAPPLGGNNALEPQQAIDRMMANRRAGYDFQPLSGDIPVVVWDSLVEEAHSRGYTFGGLIPPSVGLRTALSTGISTVDHLDGYLQEVVSDDIRARLDGGESVPLLHQLEAVEGRKMRALAAHTRSSDTWVVPTLHLWENRFSVSDVDSLLSLPEMAYVPEFISEGWILEKGAREPDPETAQLLVQVRRRILRALNMAGVGVLMGTDSPALFHIPGFSLRHELRSLQAAGLTPYEIIVTGTRNVAEYAARELLEPGNFGTVEEGNRADLLLLRGNPFEGLDALWDQEGIMIRGQWMDRESMDMQLQQLKERMGG
jgi:hypothetical protein